MGELFCGNAILDKFKNPYDVYVNRNDLLSQGRVTKKQVELIKEHAEEALEKAKIILESCENQKIKIVKYDDPEFKENIKRYDHCYPVEHQKLKCAIAENGLLISEYPPGTPAEQELLYRRR